MAAGYVNMSVKDGGGTARNVRVWSSDGTLAGDIQFAGAEEVGITMTATVTRPADTNAYAANDAFSNSTSAPTAGGGTLTDAARISGGSGVIRDIIVLYSTATAVDGEIWIYDSAPTAQNDNAAWSVTDADQAKLVAIIPFTTVADTLNAVQHIKGLDIGYTCVGTANLRFMIKIITAYTPGSADILTLRVKARGLN